MQGVPAGVAAVHLRPVHDRASDIRGAGAVARPRGGVLRLDTRVESTWIPRFRK